MDKREREEWIRERERERERERRCLMKHHGFVQFILKGKHWTRHFDETSIVSSTDNLK